MKKCLVLFLCCVPLITLIVSCTETGNSAQSITSVPDGLVIQGTVSLDASRVISREYSEQSRSVDTIESILLVHNNSVVKEKLSNNSFSIKTNYRKPAGLVFLDGNNGYKGHVQFGKNIGNNINALPLQATENENQLFDLGQLSTVDNAVYTPQNDPMDRITTNAKELSSIATFGSLFSSIVANPDFDNNGIVDVVEDKGVHAKILYYFANSPSFNGNLTPVISPESTDIGAHKFLVGLDYPEQFGAEDVSLEYPDGTVVPVGFGNKNSFFFGNQNGIPDQGEYILSIDNGTTQFNYTLDLQSTAQQVEENIAIIVPTVTLNDDNTTFHSIAWKAYQADMSVMDKPEVVMDKLEIQIDVDYVVEGYDEINVNRIYNSGWIEEVKSGVYILSRQDIIVNNVVRLMFAYDDHYGNHYVISYTH